MSPPKIGFRVDASKDIGTGHVVRCSALAHELIGYGAEVRFFCQELPGDLIEWLEIAEKFCVTRLGDNLPETAIMALNEWQRDKIDWLVVDHYSLDASWEASMRAVVKKIIVIDDLANRPHDCDLLLDQNYFPEPEKRYSGLLSEPYQLLLGPRYALLRESFLSISRQQMQGVSSAINKVLVFFGGSDPGDYTTQAIRLLQQSIELRDLGCHFDVVVGASNAQRETVEALCQGDKRFFYHCQTPHMARLLSEASLFVGAGGSTTWERLGFGLPAVVIAVADNQRELSEALAKEGAQLYLGRWNELKPEPFIGGVLTLLKDNALRQQMRHCALQWVDFLGTKRVAQRLLPRVLKLRPVTIKDCQRMFDWRNHPKTRQYIFQPDPIAYDTHYEWVKTALASNDRLLLMGYSETSEDNQDIGILRFDLERATTSALISVYLNPDLPSGLGYGTQLLIQGNQWLRTNYPWVKQIRAEILKDNLPSIRAFQKAGYHSISSERFETMAFVMK